MPDTKSSLLSTGLESLNFARHITVQMIDSIPAGQDMLQPIENGNHLRWTVGHLAWADAFFLSALSGRESTADPSWQELFGYGSTVSANAGDYPAYADLRKALDDGRAALIAWFESLSDDQLLAPIPGDLATFAENQAVLMSKLSIHEGLHSGQLSVIRRVLKLDPVLG